MHKISPVKGPISRLPIGAEHSVEYRLATSVTVAAEAGDKENPDNPFTAVIIVVAASTTVVAAKEAATTTVVAATAAQ